MFISFYSTHNRPDPDLYPHGPFCVNLSYKTDPKKTKGKSDQPWVRILKFPPRRSSVVRNANWDCFHGAYLWILLPRWVKTIKEAANHCCEIWKSFTWLLFIVIKKLGTKTKKVSGHEQRYKVGNLVCCF